jgi:hypothetical protein
MMPPLGQALGGEAAVKEMANYVLSLSGAPHDAALAAKAKEKFVMCAGLPRSGRKGQSADWRSQPYGPDLAPRRLGEESDRDDHGRSREPDAGAQGVAR